MDIFNRVTPMYRTATTATNAQPAATSGGLSGLLGSLLGNATPAYKTVDGARVSVPASSGLLASLFASATPPYKAAPAAMATDAVEDAPIDVMDAGDSDASLMPCLPTSDEVVLL